jgi:predicted oxidoreductase
VLLLDRDKAENFGGLAKESFGGIFLVGTPSSAAPASATRPNWRWPTGMPSANSTRRPLALRWAEAYTQRCHDDVGLWLRARGIGFLPAPHWVERGLFTPGNSVPRFHIVWGTGRELALRLIAALQTHPRAQNWRSASASASRAADPPGRRHRLQRRRRRRRQALRGIAGAVIVAAGGFNGNIERVRQHWHRDWKSPPPVILNGSHRYADGRLHDAVGRRRQLTHLDKMWNYAAGVRHPRPRKPNHGLSLVPPRSALWLDWRGRRIGPMPLVTGFDTRDLVAQVCATERQYSWQVMNRRIAIKELAVSGAEFNPSIRDKKKLAFLRDLLFGNRWLYEEMTPTATRLRRRARPAELVAKMNALQGDDAVELDACAQAAESLRRPDRSRPDLPQRRAVAAHRLCAALEGRSPAHLQVPEDPRSEGRPADRDPRVHHQPQEPGRHPDRPAKPRARRRRQADRRPLRGGRSGRLRRRRHARPARARRQLPRRLHPRRPHRRTGRRIIT